MEKSATGPRLIIVCGLPGSGKTTLANLMESKLGAIRFSPDEWMDALSIDRYEEGKRAKIEALQWKLTQQLLALGYFRGWPALPDQYRPRRCLYISAHGRAELAKRHALIAVSLC